MSEDFILACLDRREKSLLRYKFPSGECPGQNGHVLGPSSARCLQEQAWNVMSSAVGAVQCSPACNAGRTSKFQDPLEPCRGGTQPNTYLGSNSMLCFEEGQELLWNMTFL